jgi:Flp pilus assembly protein CpaB
VATLLRAGDRVDVLATAGDGAEPAVELVASGAVVLAAPGAAHDDGPEAAESSGLLVLAVAPETAERLAAAGAAATLTVTLGRP